jgi:hypothetical protein
LTLIRTVISSYGIIQAADSNLTDDHGQAGTGPKVFHLGFTNAALALAGAYTVNGVRMDKWMPQFISAYSTTGKPSLEGFAKALRDELEDAIGNSQVCLYHIAGYVQREHGSHPEMWFVTNAGGINSRSGDYTSVGSWKVSEDFWARDYPNEPHVFAGGGYRWYINGTPHGRIAHSAVSDSLRRLFAQIWSNGEWDFYEPRSLDGLAAIVDIEMRVIGALYLNSQYLAPYVGGDTQIVTLPPPGDAVQL